MLERILRVRVARRRGKAISRQSHAKISGRRPSPRVKHFGCPKPAGQVSEMYRGRPSIPVKNFRRVPFFGSLSWARKKGDKSVIGSAKKKRILNIVKRLFVRSSSGILHAAERSTFTTCVAFGPFGLSMTSSVTSSPSMRLLWPSPSISL
jgi:hypothetical protein